MKETTPWLHNFVCQQIHRKRLQAWSILLFEREITSFSKPMLLQSMEVEQREPLLTIVYTINSSPLLITNQVSFMLTIILSNYQ